MPSQNSMGSVPHYPRDESNEDFFRRLSVYRPPNPPRNNPDGNPNPDPDPNNNALAHFRPYQRPERTLLVPAATSIQILASQRWNLYSDADIANILDATLIDAAQSGNSDLLRQIQVLQRRRNTTNRDWWKTSSMVLLHRELLSEAETNQALARIRNIEQRGNYRGRGGFRGRGRGNFRGRGRGRGSTYRARGNLSGGYSGNRGAQGDRRSSQPFF